MKVLHILNELRPSGAEAMLRVAAHLWVEMDVQCSVLSTGAEVGPYADVLRHVGYPVHHLPYRRGLVFAWRLAQVCRRFDVVHVHTERANWTYGLAARLAGARTIRTVHNAFDYLGLVRIVRLLQRCGLRACGVQHVAIGSSVKVVEREILRNSTVLVPNWYDTALYRVPEPAEREQARHALGLDAQAIVLTVVGNCSTIKNHGSLIRALTLLPAAQRRSLVVLHVGTGSDEPAEQALASSLGLDSCIRFMGSQPSVVQALWASDAYAMPSLKEGLGNAALEAMGCGLPTLLTEVHGLRDLAATPAAIVWARGTQPEQLAAALQGLLSELPTLRTRAVAAASAIARDFSADVGVRRYLALYVIA